jgi:hypothetical protein
MAPYSLRNCLRNCLEEIITRAPDRLGFLGLVSGVELLPCPGGKHILGTE